MNSYTIVLQPSPKHIIDILKRFKTIFVIINFSRFFLKKIFNSTKDIIPTYYQKLINLDDNVTYSDMWVGNNDENETFLFKM